MFENKINDTADVMKAMNDKNSPFYVEVEQFEWIPVKGTLRGIKSQNGHLLPVMVRNLKVSKHLEVRNDDTFVVTFPKSGLTIKVL